MKSNSMDTEWAKAAARRLYQKVNFSGGPLQSYEISTLLTDTYEYLKIRIPSPIQPISQRARISNPMRKFLMPTKMDRLRLLIWKIWRYNICAGRGLLATNVSTPA